MRCALGGTCIALAMAAVLAACGQTGERQVSAETQADLARMEVRVTQQLRASLEERGLRPATADEIVATLTGNTASTSGAGGTFVTYYRPDGTLVAQLTTVHGVFRSAGTWTATDDGRRCVAVDGLRRRSAPDKWAGAPYSGAWDTIHGTSCYQVYHGGSVEYWFRVSGPDHRESGESDIIQGRAYQL